MGPFLRIASLIVVISFTIGSPAHALGPSDFFCRSLSEAGATGQVSDLQGHTMTWDAGARAAWEANPALRAHVAAYLRDTTGQPRFFTGGAGACLASNARAKGICQQTVECAAIPRDVQSEVEERFFRANGRRHPFASMDPETKRQYLAAVAPGALDWKLSTVTCGSTGARMNGLPACPPPDSCKADVETDGSIAATDPSALVQPIGIVGPEGARPAGVGR